MSTNFWGYFFDINIVREFYVLEFRDIPEVRGLSVRTAGAGNLTDGQRAAGHTRGLQDTPEGCRTHQRVAGHTSQRAAGDTRGLQYTLQCALHFGLRSSES